MQLVDQDQPDHKVNVVQLDPLVKWVYRVLLENRVRLDDQDLQEDVVNRAHKALWDHQDLQDHLEKEVQEVNKDSLVRLGCAVSRESEVSIIEI